MHIKLNIHPDKKDVRSQYIRLNLEEFLIENGVSTQKIIWRGPELLSFTSPEDKDPKKWMKTINKKFDMKLASVIKLSKN